MKKETVFLTGSDVEREEIVALCKHLTLNGSTVFVMSQFWTEGITDATIEVNKGLMKTSGEVHVVNPNGVDDICKNEIVHALTLGLVIKFLYELNDLKMWEGLVEEFGYGMYEILTNCFNSKVIFRHCSDSCVACIKMHCEYRGKGDADFHTY